MMNSKPKVRQHFGQNPREETIIIYQLGKNPGEKLEIQVGNKLYLIAIDE